MGGKNNHPNPERDREYARAYYWAHREKCIAAAAKFRLDHPDKAKALSKKWVLANPDYVKAMKRRWRVANAEKVKAGKRASYARHREKVLKQQREYNKANPQKRLEHEMRRRARMRNTTVEPVDYAQILKDSKGVCGICRKPLDLFGMHFDHIIPLSKGGTHTKDNIQVAHAHCNIVKGVKVPA